MKKEFLKIAGVEKESDFYKLFPTEEAFFGMYPEAKKLVQKNKDKLTKANIGLTTSETTRPPLPTDDRRKVYAYQDSLNLYNKQQAWLKATSDDAYNTWKIRVNKSAKDQRDYSNKTLPKSQKAYDAGQDFFNYKRISNVRNEPKEVSKYLSSSRYSDLDRKIAGSGNFGDDNLYEIITKGYTKPIQPYYLQNSNQTQFKPKPRIQPDLKMVGAERTDLAPSFTINQPPKLSYIARPENKYLVSYIDEDGVGREEYFPTRKAADDYMDWRRANNMFYGTSMSRRGVYKQGGQLPKAQVGTNVPSSTYIKKPKVQIPIGPANDPGIKKYFNTLKKHGEWGNPYTFMMNWYSDPVTKTKLKNIKFKENPVTEMLNQKLFTDYHDVMEYDFARNKKIAKNLWEGFPKEMKDFEEELNEMTYKQYEDLYNKTAGFQRGADSITAISNRPDLDFNKRQKNAVHELTHATPLDDFYSTYFKTKKPKKVLDLKTQNYFSTELHEIYPRIMELRFQMNLKPGQKVTPKMLEKYHNNGDYDLRKYYSPEELAEIMNEVAYNSKINLSQAKHGGSLLKAQVGKELPNDVNLANQKKQQLLNWYQGRMNHPDPRISTEAKQVLENMNNNYSESFPSSAIQYKPLEQFIVASKYGSYDPRQHKVQLTNPNISFNDEISKARYLPKKLIKSNREEYENMYNTSLSDEVRGHELLHYFLEKSAMPVIGTKYNKNIYSGYTDPDTYTNLLYEREGKPDLKGRDKLGFTQGAKGAYTWLTGTANTDLSPLPFKKPNPKKMFNQEMYRALMDFRNEFQIDPSKNTTPEDFKNIYQKIQENYQKAIKEKDNNKTLRYEHFLDLFNIHGNDFEKLNNLNNLLVGRSSLKQPMARDGFSVTDTTTKPAGFLDYLKTAASAVFNTPYVAASTISDQVEKSPFLSNPVVNFVDFTGTTNYPNLKQAVRDFKNAKGFWPKIGTGALLGLEGLSSFPVIAPEAKIAKQGVKGTKSAIKKITKKILTPVKGTDRITNKILPIQSLIPVSNFSRLATDFNRGGRAFRGAESLFDTFVNKLESSAAYSGEKVKLRMPDGTILVLNTDDPKYEQLYNSGKLGSWNSVDSSFNIIK